MPAAKRVQIRSGRFKLDSASAGNLIIDVGTAGSYRFINAGEEPFNVDLPNGGGVVHHKVAVDCSLDLEVTSTAAISKVGAADEVEGVYDLNSVGAQIRSGRFRSTDPDSNPVLIVKDPGGVNVKRYRVTNTGKRDFDVRLGSTNLTVERYCSLDFVAIANQVRIRRGSDLLVEGIYDLLANESEIRSGHFKIKTGNSSQSRTIIHLADGTLNPKPRAAYRIHNTGNFKFNLASATADIGIVQPNHSLDFEIPNTGTDNDRIIRVIQLVDPDDPNNFPLISGVFDFLGPPP